MITTQKMNNGRITVPKSIRETLGLKDDDLVEIDIRKPEVKPCQK